MSQALSDTSFPCGCRLNDGHLRWRTDSRRHVSWTGTPGRRTTYSGSWRSPKPRSTTSGDAAGCRHEIGCGFGVPRCGRNRVAHIVSRSTRDAVDRAGTQRSQRRCARRATWGGALCAPHKGVATAQSGRAVRCARKRRSPTCRGDSDREPPPAVGPVPARVYRLPSSASAPSPETLATSRAASTLSLEMTPPGGTRTVDSDS